MVLSERLPKLRQPLLRFAEPAEACARLVHQREIQAAHFRFGMLELNKIIGFVWERPETGSGQSATGYLAKGSGRPNGTGINRWCPNVEERASVVNWLFCFSMMSRWRVSQSRSAGTDCFCQQTSVCQLLFFSLPGGARARPGRLPRIRLIVSSATGSLQWHGAAYPRRT